MLGKIEGRRKRGRQRKRWVDSVTDPMEIVEDRGSWRATVHGIAESWT